MPRIPLTTLSFTPALRRRLLICLALATCLPALSCADVPFDSPVLTLTSPSATRDPLARDAAAPVVVRNGKGEVVLEGVPDRTGNINANPALDKLDGTLVMEQKRNDGTTRVDRFTHDPGQRVLIRRDAATDAYTAVAGGNPTLRPQGFIDFSYGAVNRPNANLLAKENGVVVLGTALTQGNESSGPEFKAGVSIPLASDSWLARSALGNPIATRLDFYGSYSTADAQDSQERVGADGDLFRIFTPGNGIVTGQDLVDMRYSSEFHESAFGAGLNKTYRFDAEDQVRLATLLGVEIGSQYVDEALDFRTSTTNTQINQRQKTTSNFVGVPIGGALYFSPFDDEGLPPWAAKRVWLYGGARFQPRWNSGDTKWSVRTTGLADRNADLSENKLTLGGELRVGMMFGDPLGIGGVPGATPITADLGAILGMKAYPQVENTDLNRGDGGAQLEYRYGTYVGARFGGKISF